MSKKWIWTGRILNWLSGLLLLSGGLNMMFFRSADLRTNFSKFGYSESVVPGIGLAVFVSAVLYLITRTSVLGAILLTGYLGGAVATHVRIVDPTFWSPALLGVVIWLAVYLQEPRLRGLLPLKRAEVPDSAART